MAQMLVLLDRDGVLNEDTPTGITRADDLRLIEGSGAAVAALNARSVKVALVTNQSVVGKGLISEDELHAIHAHLRALLAPFGATLDAIYACCDHPDAPSLRRKPAAGMLFEALHDFAADAAQTPMVGDAMRDIQAAISAGCRPHLVRTGKGEATLLDPAFLALGEVETHASLAAFVTKWLQQSAKIA